MSEPMNRRYFLGATAGTGLALSSTAAADSAPDKVVLGIMGTGGRGQQLISSFGQQPGVEIAYVCDPDQGRAERAAGLVQKASNRTPKIVSDVRKMLDDNGVNAIVVATCNHWHAPGALLAMSAGKHVYVEKPCSYTPREGEMLVEAARKHKKMVQMGNQRRSYPNTIEAIEQVRKGAIGRAYYAVSWYDSFRPSIGRGKPADPPKGLDYDLWQGPAPRKPFHTNYLHYNWHWFWHWGNGELGNNGIHTLDLCRWGLGVDYPVRVASSGGRYHFEDDQETPDTHVVSYEFDGRKQIAWEGLSCTRQPSRAFHTMFHGDQGSLALGDNGYTIYDRAGKPKPAEKAVRSDATHLSNFLNAIRNGTRLNSEIEDGHKSTLLCHLGNIAHRTGRSLRCDPKNGHILNDKEAMALWTREYDKNWEPRV